jgi:lipid II:glycine glycyltransferase (peptidoglycan interpeptide bridge formation enzyme)
MKTESESLGRGLWNEIVRSAGGHIFQTSHWGEVAEIAGTKPVPTMIDDRAVLMAHVDPLFSARRFGFVCNVLTILRGPVFRDGLFDREVFLNFLKRIDFLATQNRAVACNFFPNRPYEDAVTHRDLLGAGYRPVFDRRSFHTQTFVLDCSIPLEQLLKGMEKRTRWAIRKAERSDVRVEERSDSGGIDRFYDLYRNTAPAPIRKSFFQIVMKVLASKGLARIFLARIGASTVSTAFLLMFGDRMYYVWGGSDKLANRFCPGELLHWSIIQWGREHGYRFYDLHGVLVADAHLYGGDEKTAQVALFKRGFGGAFVRYLPQYRKVYSWMKYRTASTIRRLVREEGTKSAT